MNEAVFTSWSFSAASVRPSPALPIGFNSGKANTLTSVGLPGPGAVTMLSRPVEKSTNPVAMLTPELSSPYGLNVENSDGAAPADAGSGNGSSVRSRGRPGPDPA